jgi:DNA processing protein
VYARALFVGATFWDMQSSLTCCKIVSLGGFRVRSVTVACLIRDGATLIQNAADILETIRPIDARMVRAPTVPFDGSPLEDVDDGARRVMTDLLGPVPVAADELIRQSGFGSAIVQMVLLELELAGRLERHAGGRVSLIG